MGAGGIRMGGVFVEIGADAAKFYGAFRGVNKEIGKVGKSIQSAGKQMTALGAGIVGPIFASAAAFAAVGSTLYDMSKRTGVATEALSVLQFAANQTGTDMGGVETAVKKMQKAIFAAGNGSKEAAESLAMVGLSAGDLAGLTADQQMGKIADGLMAIEDPGTRAAVAMQIFGKSGTAILPMLEGGSAGMAAFADEAKRLGLVMDSETAAKADALGDAIDAVKASMKMAFITVGAAVAPMLTQMAQGLAILAANAGKFIGENQQFVGVVLKGGAALVVLGGAIYGVGTALKGLSAAISVVQQSLGLLSVLASPIFLIGAAIVAAGVAAYQFRGQIAGAFSGIGGYAAQAAGVIGETFGPAVRDAQVVLGDLYATASTTFTGIYDAIAAGDLSKAMDILWAGLAAGWLRGVEALMGYVDPWVAAFQNVFTDIGAGIYIAWDKIYTDSAALLNTMGAFIMGFFDNIANGVMATFDNLVAGIQIAWTRVQGLITGAKDTEERVQAIKDENAARAEQRAQERPGISGRMEKSAAENAQAEKDRQDREKAVNNDAQATKDSRQTTNDQRAADRREKTKSAEKRLAELSASASPTPAETKAIANEVTKKETPAEPPPPAPETASQGKVAGTFSSLNLGAALGASSAAERTAKATEEIAKNTRNMNGSDTVAA
jgi:hypothetical protein